MNMKIAVAMSGGIDSTAAIIKLLEQDHYCEGFTLRLYDDIEEKNDSVSPAIKKAKQLAKEIGIKHHVVDLRQEFKETIIRYFIDSYLTGTTPNPCIFCNPIIKFGKLFEIIDSHGFGKLATGHYAIISSSDYGMVLQKGKDRTKDQSYFLSRIDKKILPHLVFPLGHFKKDDIRRFMANKGFYFSNEESQEICFIPNDDYESYLRKNAGEITTGNFVTQTGKIAGTHKGIPFYTIGQRRGLGVSLGKPGYVRKINIEDNSIEIGDKLWVDDFSVNNINVFIPELLDSVLTVKIRYRSEGEKCKIVRSSENTWTIKLEKSMSSVTPGQAAVFYHGDIVVAGGIIKKY